MIYEATTRKSRTQWANELKGTEYKTFTHPTGCKRGHPKLFSVSEDGKCVECVRLKDAKRTAKRHGQTLEEYRQQKNEEKRQRDETESLRIADAAFQRHIKKQEDDAQPEVGHVYSLSCAATNRTYIGSTRNLKARMSHHLCHIRKGTHHVSELLDDLATHGHDTLKIDVLCTVHSGDRTQVEALERFYLDTWQGPLLNKFKPTSTLRA